MTPDRLGWKITSREEWLERRRPHITGNRVGALFNGVHPFLDTSGLAAEIRGTAPPKPLSPGMREGIILEPGIPIAVLEEHPDWQITKADTYHCDPLLQAGCTPDFWLGDNGVLSVTAISGEQWALYHGTAPLWKILQLSLELMITGREYGVLAVLLRKPGFPLHLYDVPRHPGAEARIEEAIRRWWSEWDADRLATPVDSTPLREAFDDGSHLDWSDKPWLRELAEKRTALKAIQKQTDKELKHIDDTLKGEMGDARTAWLPGWSISYPAISRQEYTVPAGTYRRLTVTELKEKDE